VRERNGSRSRPEGGSESIVIFIWFDFLKWHTMPVGVVVCFFLYNVCGCRWTERVYEINDGCIEGKRRGS